MESILSMKEVKSVDEMIRLSHGDGGRDTNDLIKNVFYRHFNNSNSISMKDSFDFVTKGERFSYTTDSFVVKPLFFRGGDIGKLSVCGTINDLVTAGAIPLYISAAFIIEEGFSISKLNLIAKSMQDICNQTGARIITGDTKVVEKGSVDGLYINTSGIGLISEHFDYSKAKPGDEIIITGGIGEHGASILLERYGLGIETSLESDCAPMCSLLNSLGKSLKHVKIMKDPTRGGIATALNEIALEQNLDIELNEEAIPIKDEVKGICSLLGIDPFYLASEGRMIIIVEKGYGEEVINRIKGIYNCSNARVIGYFTADNNGIAYMNTYIGGKRIIPTLTNPMLPRIC